MAAPHASLVTLLKIIVVFQKVVVGGTAAVALQGLMVTGILLVTTLAGHQAFTGTLGKILPLTLSGPPE